MQSDWKKVLIMGVISIIISVFAFLSFNDVKFKNTKKVVEEYERQQLELQLASEYESINNQNTVVDNNIWITTWELKILVPNFLANSWFENIAKILQWEWIDVSFSYATDMNKLKLEVMQWMADYDLYIIPSNWILWLNLEWIYLGENIKPYFIPIFQDMLSEYENTFIPYSLDPFVTMTKIWISDINTWAKLFSYTTLWSQGKAYAMPIIWWIWNSDIELLKSGTWPFENYFDILYWQIELIKKKHSNTELNNMLDVEKIDLWFKYNYESFYNIYSRLTKSNSYCEYYPAVCMFAYNFGDIKFGFISDFDILDKYFPEAWNNFVALEFTNSDIEYPTRWWWFVIPKWNKNKNLSIKFLWVYIADAVDGDLSLRWNTLPAINNMYDTKKSGILYNNIMNYEDKFILYLDDINLQDNFANNSRNINLLQWFYSPEVYINT